MKDIKIKAMELINYLRNRINPEYAATKGTESYERRLCAEALESLLDEVEDAKAAALFYVRDETLTPRQALTRQAAEIERLRAEIEQRDCEISILKELLLSYEST